MADIKRSNFPIANREIALPIKITNPQVVEIPKASDTFVQILSVVQSIFVPAPDVVVPAPDFNKINRLKLKEFVDDSSTQVTKISLWTKGNTCQHNAD